MANRQVHTMREPWMLASCHIMAHTTDWVVYLVCRSFSHSEKLCMAPGSPKFTQDVSKGQMQMQPAPVTSHQGIRCRWVVPERVWPLGTDNAMPATCCSASLVCAFKKSNYILLHYKNLPPCLSVIQRFPCSVQGAMFLRRVSQSQLLSCSRVMRELCTNFEKCVSQSKFENNSGSYSRVMHELKFENKCVSQSMHKLLFLSYARVMHKSWRITYSRGRASITQEQAAKSTIK